MGSTALYPISRHVMTKPDTTSKRTTVSDQITAPPFSDREIIVSRIVEAEGERVWQAFRDPEALAKWWGPDGFTLTTRMFEFEEGGDWIFVMHGPDGRDYPNRIRFIRIEAPTLMEHDHGDNERVMFRARITLDDLGGRTRVTLHSTFATASDRDFVVKEHHAIEGGNQTLARLDQYLANK